jgi:DNA primase
MHDQVDEVKSKVDIVSILGEYIQVKKAGRNYKALCPFHGEKTPSFMISPQLQIYKCFGCGETGDVFTFLEKYEGMEFPEALKHLADKVGVKLVSTNFEGSGEKERLFELNNLTSRFYSYVLNNHPLGKIALDYLIHDRGLTQDTINLFQLGFSPNSFGALKGFLVEKKKFTVAEGEKAGIFYLKGGQAIDRFRGRVIFPLFDHRGNVTGFAGRIMPNEANKELAKYINTPETPVYHKSNLLFGLNLAKEAIKIQKEAVVVEGELDMISSWQVGVKNVVAIKGSALTEEQVRLLGRFTKKIILALDSDMAGDMAARRGIVVAQKAGLEITVAKLGDYKDPDEAARGNPELYKKALTQTEGVWDFILDSIFSKHDIKSGSGLQAASTELAPVLASIPDKIVQAHYIDVVSRRLGVPMEAVGQEVERAEKGKDETIAKIEVPFKKEEKNRRQLLEERLLTLAFQSDPVFLLKPKVQTLISTPLPRRILEEYLKYQDGGEKFEVEKFIQTLPKELLPGYTDMLLKDLDDLVEKPDALENESLMVVRELEILEIRHKLEILGAKMRESEEEEDKEKVIQAQEKFRELTLKLSKFEDERKRGIILQED